jgi:hypothetical protein
MNASLERHKQNDHLPKLKDKFLLEKPAMLSRQRQSFLQPLGFVTQKNRT